MKRNIVLILCGALVVGGLWFSTTNAFKFLQGYFLFKTGSAQTEVVEVSGENTEPIVDEDAVADVEVVEEDADPSSFPLEPQIGELMGELYIPKLDATLPIYHGTDEDELEKGVGHFAGSVLPGENDNSVLAGHRDTVFRKLGEVRENDLLIVTTGKGVFEYKVRRVRIVDEDDRTVIVPRPRATLTVSTCYPFNFVGAAPERYVLVAELKGEKERK
ncbi:class D sortase [Alkalihalobacillus sp. MEB130]|uniref:class D sortase n=1 Tax=Alkalihalobacillus sp. MEB130 TaxID=2976704 RepID=UPI0028DFA464|nr:class D sortase [Alkalihalobacillus sp. MEB130]MDT8860346.1 class D sortase [Alkalihalobacillus sp. MEB130]